jgi:hypothetical protein
MTFAEVKTVIPQARANDAGAVSGCTGWFVELPDRPYYGGKFTWSGRAWNAYEAKQKMWSELLKKLAPQPARTPGAYPEARKADGSGMGGTG